MNRLIDSSSVSGSVCLDVTRLGLYANRPAAFPPELGQDFGCGRRAPLKVI
jgi:hypothetical protein